MSAMRIIRTEGRGSGWTRWAFSSRGLWLVWCGVILAVTTLPWTDFQGHAHWDSVRWIPFQDSSFSSSVSRMDILTNFLLFAPFGFLYAISRSALSWRGGLEIACVALVFSASVELYQVFTHGRIPSTTDLTVNTLGAISGALGGFRNLLRSRQLAAGISDHPAPLLRSAGDNQLGSA